MEYSVTKDGIPLEQSLYTFDKKTRTFSSNEDGLVLDFSGINGVIFNTGSNCNFTTGFSCTFKTGSSCVFNTGAYCTFNTGDECTFKTGSKCVFNTGYDCFFYTGNGCTFNTYSDCVFTTGSECVIVRRDIYEIIAPPFNNTIKLNKYWIRGFTIVEPKYIEIQGYKIDVEKGKELGFIIKK